jgi:uncharacterized protein YecT (DUF1311 family)
MLVPKWDWCNDICIRRRLLHTTNFEKLPMFRSMLLFLSLLCVPAAAHATAPPDPQCDAQTTLGIVDCLSARTKAWDQRLNVAYQALTQRSDAGQQQPLKAAQRLWLQYRDANCRYYASAEGSIRQIEAAECLRAMTQARACELDAARRHEAVARCE